MLEEHQARQKILDAVEPGPASALPIAQASGLILAQDIVARLDSPPFDNSSMDGYAVRAVEARTGAILSVAPEAQPAGLDRKAKLEPGGAIRIFTGGAMPEGADAVVMQEDTGREGDQLRIREGVEPGENLRRRGGDVCTGQKLLERGELLSPASIGLLASQGIAEVPVHRRPRVRIVTNGDELVEAGAGLRPGEIHNSNGPMLRAAAEAAGAIAESDHSRDDPGELARVLASGLEDADFVVIAGGVSVGDRDFVGAALDELGVSTEFWKVRIKPGKPFLFGRHPDGALVFGLPGNPVSAYVTFRLFVVPAIRKRLGHRNDQCRESAGNSLPGLRSVEAIAAEAMNNPGDRPHYLRARREGNRIFLSGTQQSHAIFGLSQASCLVRLEPGQAVQAGKRIVVIPL